MKGIRGLLRRKNVGPPGTRRTLSFHLSLGNDPPALAVHKPYTNRTCSRETARWSREKEGTNTLGSHLSPSPASETFRWWVALIFSHDFSDLSVQFSSVQSLTRVRLFATPWIAAHQASLSITNSRSLLRLTSIKSVMPSSHHQINHLISQEKTAASHETKQLIQKKLRAGIGPRTPDSLWGLLASYLVPATESSDGWKHLQNPQSSLFLIEQQNEMCCY